MNSKSHKAILCIAIAVIMQLQMMHTPVMAAPHNVAAEQTQPNSIATLTPYNEDASKKVEKYVPTSLSMLDAGQNEQNGKEADVGEATFAALWAFDGLPNIRNEQHGGMAAKSGKLAEVAAVQPFAANPQTQYARDFIAKSAGQQWFLEEVEKLLNAQHLSINILNSAQDFAYIYSLNTTDKGYSGTIPPAIGELFNLKTLFLSGNSFTGTLPSEIYNLTSLTELDLSKNELSGQIPTNLTAFTNLKALQLYSNKFTGQIPAQISQMQSLRVLDLSDNPLGGTIPQSLGSMPNLQILSFSKCELTGTIPPELGQNRELLSLMGWGNKLRGSIPSSLSNLTKLQVLDFSQNQLVGTIPSSFSTLQKLTRLAVFENNLSGEIPPVCSLLTNLSILDLSKNQFSGMLPTSYAALVKLTKLDISHNQIRGKLTDIFGGMNSLKLLYLTNNFFTGTVPQSLVSLQSAGADVDIFCNYLTGENAKTIIKNGDNYIDQATTVQNQLSLPSKMQLVVGQKYNIYDILATVTKSTGILNNKQKLFVQEYVEVDTHPQTVSTAVYASGQTVWATEELVAPVLLKIQILNNNGSAYSTATIEVYTKNPTDTGGVPGGGGGSGGGGGTGSGGGGTGTGVLGPVASSGHKAYIKGYEDKTVRAEANMTREEAATVLFRLITDGQPIDNSALIDANYIDVSKDRWSALAVAYLSKNGIITGYNGEFRPSDNITRAEFAAIMSRYKNLSGHETTFLDAKGHWAEKFIDASSKAGYIKGYPNGKFEPDAKTTRAEAIVVTNRVFFRQPDKNSVQAKNPYSDLMNEYWAYFDIIEATIEHSFFVKDGIEKWQNSL